MARVRNPAPAANKSKINYRALGRHGSFIISDMNHLSNSTSPYLLQHANNPVDWYPWGEEASARAKAENKPIFLSIGYAACHWCHVMAHESFEDLTLRP